MSTLDLTPIVQPILETIGLMIAGLIAAYVPKAIAAFQARTGIMLTDQQRATMLGAVQTAAGAIETRLDQGLMHVAHVNVSDPTVLAEARAALDAVPATAASLGMTEAGVAKMIVGAVDTSSRTTAVVVPAPVAPATVVQPPLAAAVTGLASVAPASTAVVQNVA